MCRREGERERLYSANLVRIEYDSRFFIADDDAENSEKRSNPAGIMVPQVNGHCIAFHCFAGGVTTEVLEDYNTVLYVCIPDNRERESESERGERKRKSEREGGREKERKRERVHYLAAGRFGFSPCFRISDIAVATRKFIAPI